MITNGQRFKSIKDGKTREVTRVIQDSLAGSVVMLRCLDCEIITSDIITPYPLNKFLKALESGNWIEIK